MLVTQCAPIFWGLCVNCWAYCIWSTLNIGISHPHVKEMPSAYWMLHQGVTLVINEQTCPLSLFLPLACFFVLSPGTAIQSLLPCGVGTRTKPLWPVPISFWLGTLPQLYCTSMMKANQLITGTAHTNETKHSHSTGHLDKAIKSHMDLCLNR